MRASGGYEISVWAPLGLSLLAIAAAAVASGRPVPRRVVAAAAALVALGAWAAASAAWGGIPTQGWLALGRALVEAAALVVGALAGGSAALRARVPLAVVAAAVALALEVVVRSARGTAPGSWFAGRMLEGPVGYHNAQGAWFALAIPLAVALLVERRAFARAAGAAAATILVGGLLLTQSRGAIVAAAVAVALQLVLCRDARLVLRLVPLAGAAAVLALALGPVDAALVAGTGRAAAFRSFALWLVPTAAAAAALAALPLPGRGVRAAAAAVVVAAAVAGGAGLAATAGRPVERALSELRSDRAPTSAAGRSRLLDLSLNGRRDAWRVAALTFSRHAWLGAGVGAYTREWARERRLTDLSILQPHSLELEIASELGVPGLVLLAAFAGLSAWAVAAGGGARSAAAGAALVALGLQASWDWVWSFPAIVVAALLVAGAAAAPARRRGGPGPRSAARIAWCAVAAVAAAALVPPYLAARENDRAAALWARDPVAAWSAAASARRFDPWSSTALELQGRLALSNGEYRLALARFEQAAPLSRQPWVDQFLAAAAARAARDAGAAARLCRLAQRGAPGEPLLRQGPCAAQAVSPSRRPSSAAAGRSTSARPASS